MKRTVSQTSGLLKKIVNDQIKEFEKAERKRRELLLGDWEPLPPSSCYCSVTNAPCSWCTRQECDHCGEDVSEEGEECVFDSGDTFNLVCKECRKEEVEN